MRMGDVVELCGRLENDPRGIWRNDAADRKWKIELGEKREVCY